MTPRVARLARARGPPGLRGVTQPRPRPRCSLTLRTYFSATAWSEKSCLRLPSPPFDFMQSRSPSRDFGLIHQCACCRRVMGPASQRHLGYHPCELQTEQKAQCLKSPKKSGDESRDRGGTCDVDIGGAHMEIFLRRRGFESQNERPQREIKTKKTQAEGRQLTSTTASSSRCICCRSPLVCSRLEAIITCSLSLAARELPRTPFAFKKSNFS